jgi:hypothetical protein
VGRSPQEAKKKQREDSTTEKDTGRHRGGGAQTGGVANRAPGAATITRPSGREESGPKGEAASYRHHRRGPRHRRDPECSPTTMATTSTGPHRPHRDFWREPAARGRGGTWEGCLPPGPPPALKPAPRGMVSRLPTGSGGGGRRREAK